MKITNMGKSLGKIPSVEGKSKKIVSFLQDNSGGFYTVSGIINTLSDVSVYDISSSFHNKYFLRINSSLLIGKLSDRKIKIDGTLREEEFLRNSISYLYFIPHEWDVLEIKKGIEEIDKLLNVKYPEKEKEINRKLIELCLNKMSINREKAIKIISSIALEEILDAAEETEERRYLKKESATYLFSECFDFKAFMISNNWKMIDCNSGKKVFICCKEEKTSRVGMFLGMTPDEAKRKVFVTLGDVSSEMYGASCYEMILITVQEEALAGGHLYDYVREKTQQMFNKTFASLDELRKNPPEDYDREYFLDWADDNIPESNIIDFLEMILKSPHAEEIGDDVVCFYQSEDWAGACLNIYPIKYLLEQKEFFK